MRVSPQFLSPRTASAATGAIPTDAPSCSQAGQALFICQPSYSKSYKGFPDKNGEEDDPQANPCKAGSIFSHAVATSRKLRCSLVQLPLNRVLDQFAPAPQRELLFQMGLVGLHCLHAEVQLVSDLAGTPALADGAEDLELAIG
jgi:hypothetical protein